MSYTVSPSKLTGRPWKVHDSSIVFLPMRDMEAYEGAPYYSIHPNWIEAVSIIVPRKHTVERRCCEYHRPAITAMVKHFPDRRACSSSSCLLSVNPI